VVRVKEMSEFEQTCCLTSLKITVLNFWVMTPYYLASVLDSPIYMYDLQQQGDIRHSMRGYVSFIRENIK